MDLFFGRVEARIGLGNSRTGVNQPLVELSAQLANRLGMLCGHVVTFSGVIGQLIQLIPAVFPVVDQFPIALAENRGRFATLVSIMRIVPVQRAVVDPLAAHQRH